MGKWRECLCTCNNNQIRNYVQPLELVKLGDLMTHTHSAFLGFFKAVKICELSRLISVLIILSKIVMWFNLKEYMN